MSRRKDGGVEAPVSLLGLFNEGSEEGTGFVQEYEEQSLQLVEATIVVRQFSWHEANGWISLYIYVYIYIYTFLFDLFSSLIQSLHPPYFAPSLHFSKQSLAWYLHVSRVHDEE